MKYLILTSIGVLSFSICTGQWTTNKLSIPKGFMGAAVAEGSHTFWFAGGDNGSGSLRGVEIYDAETGTWTYSQLSQARAYPVGVASPLISSQSKAYRVFFAGGVDLPSFQASSTVDIWESKLGEWSVSNLSVPRWSLSAALANDEVLFAGGLDMQTGVSYDVVDIYNFGSKEWTIASLSEPRAAMGSAVVETSSGPVAVFAGGFNLETQTVSDKVDFYHFKTRTWSFATLSEPRGFVAAASVNGKVVIGGGMTNDNVASDVVDIYDFEAQRWSLSHLSVPRAFIENAATVCGKVFFAGGGIMDLNTLTWQSSSRMIDIYSDRSGGWAVYLLSNAVVNHNVIADGNLVLMAGGADINGVAVSSNIDIYSCPFAQLSGVSSTSASTFNVYPNPGFGELIIQSPDDFIPLNATIRIYDMQGHHLGDELLQANNYSLRTKLEPGTYVLNIVADGFHQSTLVHVL